MLLVQNIECASFIQISCFEMQELRTSSSFLAVLGLKLLFLLVATLFFPSFSSDDDDDNDDSEEEPSHRCMNANTHIVAPKSSTAAWLLPLFPWWLPMLFEDRGK